MGFITVLKIMLALIIPFLIFLGAANLIVFDKQYYAGKLPEYGINIPDASFLNEKTIDFIAGKNNALPDAYNERERQHLTDVRNMVKISRIAFYSSMLLLTSLLLASALIIRMGRNPANLIGKALAYGGILTIVLAFLLIFLISLNFTSAFESFHKLFFRQGTYTFDPENEIIVRLYPEELFMDLGLRIAKWVAFTSLIFIIIGLLLIFKSKKQKIKKIGKARD